MLAYGRAIAKVYLRRRWTERVWCGTRRPTPGFLPAAGNRQRPRLVWVGNWGDGERSEELREFLVRPVVSLKLKAAVYGVRYPEHALSELASAGIAYGGWVANFRVPEIFARARATRPDARASRALLRLSNGQGALLRCRSGALLAAAAATAPLEYGLYGHLLSQPASACWIACYWSRPSVSRWGEWSWPERSTRKNMIHAGYSPSVRLFEAAACACPVISDWWEGLDDFFKVGEEILVADSPEQVATYLFELPVAERRAIAKKSARGF